MLDVFVLITPVIAIIVAGAWARRSGFLADGFWAPAEKLGYRVLLPALIIDALATNQLPPNAESFGVAIVLTILCISVPMFAVRALAGWAWPAFASVHQGALRLNGLLAIATVMALIGEPALPLIGVLVAVWVPVSNGLSVYAYAVGTGRTRPMIIARSVLANPMVAAVIIGAVLNVIGAGPLLERFFLFDLLGRAALPVGLLAVGAALDLRALRTPDARVGVALVLKLALMPALMLGVCHWLDAGPLITAVAVICAAMPSSPSGYLVARQMDGDHSLMATIIIAQTVLSAVSVPLWGALALAGLHR